ncbi:MAG: signal peptidase I [Tannerella sp.]|nr:signal peptidase I [Tannerella sp.]
MTNRKVIKRRIKFFGLLILICMILRVFVGEVCAVPSDSMYPAILAGDRLWIDYTTYGARLPRRFADIPLFNVFTWIAPLRKADEKIDWGYRRIRGRRMPEIGDMAVFESPERQNVLLVKRITNILNAGDTVVVNENNFENMRRIVENEGQRIFKRNGTLYIDGRKDSVFIVKQPLYEMRGDNTQQSHDSRNFGYIPYSNITGRIKFVFYSIDNGKKGFQKIRWNSFFKSAK